MPRDNRIKSLFEVGHDVVGELDLRLGGVLELEDGGCDLSEAVGLGQGLRMIHNFHAVNTIALHHPSIAVVSVCLVFHKIVVLLRRSTIAGTTAHPFG